MKRLIIILTVLILIGCGHRNEKDDSVHGSPNFSTPVSGGAVIIGMRPEPDALNPLTAMTQTANSVIRLIFCQLVDMSPDLRKTHPVLARSWQFSADSLNLSFNLRSDVKWHDGVPFTARDVWFTWKMHTNPKVAWDGMALKKDIDTVLIKNDTTVVFKFKSRTKNMLMNVVEGYIVPEHILKNVDPGTIFSHDFNQHPIGTGPYKIKNWKKQQYIYLTKNDHYFKKGQPYLNEVVFKLIADDHTIFRMLKSGDIDFANNISAANYQQLLDNQKKGHENLKFIQILARNYDYIGWNLIDPENYSNVLKKHGSSMSLLNEYLKPHPLFGNPEIRAAITMAIDRIKINDLVNHGFAKIMNGPVPLILDVYNESANHNWPYNPDSALKILEKNGWVDSNNDGILDKDEKNFSFEIITNSGNTTREQILTILQQQLKQIKVEVIPRVVEPGYLVGRILPQKNFDAVLIGWGVSMANDMSPLFHSSSFFSPFHFTGYVSAKFDSLQTVLNNSFDKKTIQQTTDQMAGLLSNDLPYTWLYYLKNCIAYNRRIQNVKIDKTGGYGNIDSWWIPKEQQHYADYRQ